VRERTDAVAVDYPATRRFDRKAAQAVLQRHLRVSVVIDDLNPVQPRDEDQKNGQGDEKQDVKTPPFRGSVPRRAQVRFSP
jgi:hypothetical protein